MDFKKYFCPVCNNQFNDEDDVVVCPECGTPHHRECYKNNGGCFNVKLHGSEESLEFTYKNNSHETEIKTIEIEENKNEEKNTTFETIPDILKGSPAKSVLIDGKYSALYEIAIGKNSEYYIPRFMIMSELKKGLSLNMIAFFAPLAWSLYRKMYKFAAIIFAMYVLIFGLTGFYIASNEEFVDLNIQCMQEDPNYMSNILIYDSGKGDVTLTLKQQELLEVMKNMTLPFYVTFISGVLPFIARAFLGLFGNKQYMNKLKNNIDKAEKRGLQGDDLKKYLYKKYRTFPLVISAIIGFFEIFYMYL